MNETKSMMEHCVVDNTSHGGQEEHEESVSDEHAANSIESCRCLPACSSIHYDAELSQTKVDKVQHWKARGFSDDDDDE